MQVSTSLDSEGSRILVKVSEGPRCLQAGIRVTGAGTIPVGLLRRRLTQIPPSANPTNQSISERLQALQSNQPKTSNQVPSISFDSPAWEPGQPASFAPSSLDALSQGIDGALRELGYFFTRTEVKIVPDTNHGTADLLIAVLDEGSSGVIDQINLSGLRRNRRADVLKYLALKPGLPVNRPLLIRTENLLWRSARFLDFTVTPEIVPERNHINLKIALTEYDPMPPLQQDLSREAKALLRFCDWLSDQPSSGQDIVVAVGTLEQPLPWPGLRTARVILSPRGLLITAGEDAGGEAAPPLYAALAARDTVGLFDLARHSKLAMALTNSRFQSTAFLNILPNPDPAAESPFSMTFGGGVIGVYDKTDPARTNSAPSFRMQRLLAPLVFAAHAYEHKQDIHFSFSKGLMTLTNKDWRLTTEEKSGKMVELEHAGQGQKNRRSCFHSKPGL